MTDDTPDEPSDDARHGRRAVVAGLAGTGAGIAAYVAIHGVPGINGPDPPPSLPSDERRTASRPADAGGFANRDESYASSTEPISAIHEPPPTLVFPTAGEAAAATAVTVPTILDTSDPAIHLLRRVTFGPTPELVDEVHAQGIDGWLATQLDALGPGTTFRAVSVGTAVTRSLAGDQAAVSIRSVDGFKLAVRDDQHARTTQALAALYTGLDHPLATDVATTLAGLETARLVAATEYRPAATYPDGDFATGLAETARLVKSDLGLRVAAIDVGGWDMHTDLGTVDDGAMAGRLGDLGTALGAFTADLGDRLDDVTVVVVTEFGRRVEQNANAGTDHGHGAAALLLGGGVAGGTIHGTWHGLAPDLLDHGDVPGWNDYRDVLGEVVTARLGVSPGALTAVFPGHRAQRVGVMR
jgi:uncharacterized protein (DUF1501 family)